MNNDNETFEDFRFCLPFIGSKRLIARNIIDIIIQENPKIKYLYDLFGGGGAISFKALTYPNFHKVIYNDIYYPLFNFLEKLLNEKEKDLTLLEFVTKEEYKNVMRNNNDWKKFFYKTVWSFSSKGTSYRLFKGFNDDLVKTYFDFLKKHNYNGDRDKRLQLKEEFKKMYIKEDPNSFFMRNVQKIFQPMERIYLLQEFLHSNNNKDRLVILNKDYKEIEIDTPIEETVIYLDPPYVNNKSSNNSYYNLKLNKEFFSSLYKYIKESPYTIYLSESYELQDLRLVKTFKFAKLLTRVKGDQPRFEFLYCNR